MLINFICLASLVKKHLKRVTLLHATFFTFAKESGGLQEKEHGGSWILWDRSKNVIFGFFGVEKLIKIFISSSRNIKNFEKIDLQNWNLREFHRSHVTIFWTFFDANVFVGHQLRVDRGSQNSKVKWGHLRSNLRFWQKNSVSMTHSTISHENIRIYVILHNNNNRGVKFHLRSLGVKWGHFYENRVF